MLTYTYDYIYIIKYYKEVKLYYNIYSKNIYYKQNLKIKKLEFISACLSNFSLATVSIRITNQYVLENK